MLAGGWCKPLPKDWSLAEQKLALCSVLALFADTTAELFLATKRVMWGEKCFSSQLSSIISMRMGGICSNLPHQNQIRRWKRKQYPKCLYIIAVFLGVSLEEIVPRLLQEQTYSPCAGQGHSQYRQDTSSIITVLEMCSQNNPCHLNKKLVKRLKCIYHTLQEENNIHFIATTKHIQTRLL